jgi:hypothetical protein
MRRRAITTVGKKHFGGWQGIKDQPLTLVIAHLPFAEQQNEGFALAVADSVELRVPSKARTQSGFASENWRLLS